MRRTCFVLAIVAAAMWIAAASFAEEQAAPTEADAAVATEIEHRLTRDREVNAQTVEIDVRGGVVTLSGRVVAQDAKKRAETVAATVPGVRDVRNQITVSGGAGMGGEGGPGPIPEQMPGSE